jgi:hypothetical protein
LLEVSGAIASQPNLKAVLQSLRRLLSNVVAFDSVSLSLMSDNGNSVRLVAFDRGSDQVNEVEVTVTTKPDALWPALHRTG